MDEAGAACGHGATEFLRATPFGLKKRNRLKRRGAGNFCDQ